MLVLGFFQIFFRYILRMPLSWSEELIRYLFVWSTFLGMPIGFDRGSHASFDLFSKRIPSRYIPYYQTFLLLLALTVFLFLIVYGFPFMARNFRQYTPALRLPYAVVIAAVPVGSLVGVVYVLHAIFRLYGKEAN
ncbi:MAG: TRAP transporter small permease [Synergistaceae bacterium]|nr:TRAP transporter small permease [Synergistaceae bacterium]